MRIKRDRYLNTLIRHMHNGMIKVVTGIRRCGKSYLLFELFYEHLRTSGVDDEHIIRLALDDRRNAAYRDPDALYGYVCGKIADDGMYYILLDEVQFVKEFEDVLNGFLHIRNADTYVTGSNAKFLSKDIITEFRGRGDQIHVYPLSFAEFMSAFDGSEEYGWRQYMTFGGLPMILSMKDDEDKSRYLQSILEETYIKDIAERGGLRSDAELEELLDILASSIGSPTNPKKLSDTFKTLKNKAIHPDTIKRYIDLLSDAFMVSQARRYDVKGKKYINTPSKYYFTDMGLRNARLNFRQLEESHIMENIVYNELVMRGYNTDVGVVEKYARTEDGKRELRRAEIDFVCNMADRRRYVQVTRSLSDESVLCREFAPLLSVNDAFEKIVIVKDLAHTHYTDDGILLLRLSDFLLASGSDQVF